MPATLARPPTGALPTLTSCCVGWGSSAYAATGWSWRGGWRSWRSGSRSGPVFDRLVPTQGGADSESIRGYDLLSDASPYDGQVVAVVDGATPDDPALTGVASDLEQLGGVGRVRWPGTPGSTDLVATDGRAVAFVIDLSRDTEDAPVDQDFTVEQIESVLGLLQRDGVGTVLVGGDLLVFEEVNEQVQRDITRAELIALPISLVVLILIFGGLIPAGLPIIAAVASIGQSAAR